MDQNVKSSIVRRDGRGFSGGPLPPDQNGWYITLVFDADDAYQRTKVWVEENEDKLGYIQDLEDLV